MSAQGAHADIRRDWHPTGLMPTFARSTTRRCLFAAPVTGFTFKTSSLRFGVCSCLVSAVRRNTHCFSPNDKILTTGLLRHIPNGYSSQRQQKTNPRAPHDLPLTAYPLPLITALMSFFAFTSALPLWLILFLASRLIWAKVFPVFSTTKTGS